MTSLVSRIHKLGKKACVAVSPAEPIESISWVLDEIDMVTLLSVNPGHSGQVFRPAVYSKIWQTSRKIAMKRTVNANRR